MQVQDKFIADVINCLEYEAECSNLVLDIPFMIAPLEQVLGGVEELIQDIRDYDYRIFYEPDKENGYTNGALHIHLSSQSKGNPNHMYQIVLGFDQRFYNGGSCHCEGSDTDYRAGKGYCGHHSDWIAPKITTRKVIEVLECSFIGDEHDYWKYEDEFHSNAEKLQREKESRITYLKNSIKSMQYELAELA